MLIIMHALPPLVLATGGMCTADLQELSHATCCRCDAHAVRCLRAVSADPTSEKDEVFCCKVDAPLHHKGDPADGCADEAAPHQHQAAFSSPQI